MSHPADPSRVGARLHDFDALQLDVVCQPADSALDVAATLYDLGNETAQSAAPRSAEDWYGTCPRQDSNLRPAA